MTGPVLIVAADDPTPPFEQLRRQFVHLIGSGVIASGERLPPVRQLASDLGLAAGTVARTYRELETAGLIHSKRGAGTRVAENSASIPANERQRLLTAEAIAYLRHAVLLGVDPAAAIHAVQQSVPAVYGTAAESQL